MCAEYGQLDLFQWFHDKFAADLNSVNTDGETPMMLAAREGKIDILKYYIT